MTGNRRIDTAVLGEVMDTRFVMAVSTWSIETLIKFLSQARFSHLVVLREENEARYHYLYSRREVGFVLARSDLRSTLHDAFDLHEYVSVPELKVSDTNVMSYARAVVRDDARVVGFIDTQEPPVPRSSESRSLNRILGASSGPFTAYPSLSAPEEVAEGNPFDIFVGFRDKPDPKLGNADPIVIDKLDHGEHCLVVVSGDGITVDPDHELVPLKVNAIVRLSGTLNPGVTKASIKALFRRFRIKLLCTRLWLPRTRTIQWPSWKWEHPPTGTSAEALQRLRRTLRQSALP